MNSNKSIKNTLKSLWLHKPTVFFTLINLLIFIITDTQYALLNFLYCLLVNIIALLLVNLNMIDIKKNYSDKYEVYYKWLPGSFNVIRFAVGGIAIGILSFIQTLYPMDIVSKNALAITFSWYVIPLVSTLIVSASVDNEFKTKNPLRNWVLQIKYLYIFIINEDNDKSSKKRLINSIGLTILLGSPVVYTFYRLYIAIMHVINIVR